MTMPDLQRYPLKLCLIKACIRYPFFSLNCSFSFVVTLQKCPAYFLEKFTELNTFWFSKTTATFHIFDQVKISRFRCKSGIAIFKLRGHLNLRLQSLLFAFLMQIRLFNAGYHTHSVCFYSVCISFTVFVFTQSVSLL